MNYESLSPSLQALYCHVYAVVINATMQYDDSGTKPAWKHAIANEAALDAVRVASSNPYPDLPPLDKLAPLLRAFRDGADRGELQIALMDARPKVAVSSADAIVQKLDAKAAAIVERGAEELKRLANAPVDVQCECGKEYTSTQRYRMPYTISCSACGRGVKLEVPT